MTETSKSTSRILSMLEKVIDFFTRRKLLYKSIGWLVAVSLISELGAFDLESKVQIDYENISANYGWITASLLAWVIGFFAGGYDLLSVIVKSGVLLICLFFDFKVQTKEGNKKTIWNIFFGIKQDINQNYDLRDDE